MATVVYPRPSPWDQIPQGISQLMGGIANLRDQTLMPQDLETIAQTGQDPANANWAEVMGKMKTRKGKELALQMMVKNQPRELVTVSPSGEITGRTKVPGGAEVIQQKTDPAALEAQRQEGRERLELKREDLRMKIEDLKDQRLTRQFGAQEERQLKAFQQQADMMDKRMAATKEQQQANELDLTPDAIDAMARRYILDGTMPGLGLGKAATKARSMVMNRVAGIMREEDLSPQDLTTNKVVLGGLRSEANRLLGQRGPMLAFAKTADKNLDIALNLSSKVDRTGAPVINRWLLAGKKQIAGDPDVSAFHAATQVAINEFAKVTSSATGGGVTSDTARKEIEEILNSAQNPEQFKAVVRTLRMDMDNRIAGYENSLKRITEASKELGQKAPAGKSGGKGPQYSTQDLQTAYSQKAQEIAAMPQGPAKQNAERALQAWKQKYLTPGAM